MLVSHHPPCDYDRTLFFLGIHVCVRCLGMLGGTFAGCFVNQAWMGVPGAWLVMIGLGFTLPAALDFAAHELTKGYRSTNFRRIITGGMFGVAVGACLAHAWEGKWWPLLCLLAYFALLEIVIAGLFRISGHLDSYVARYAEAVYINEKDTRDGA